MAKTAEKSPSQTEILKLPYLVLIVSLLITCGATFIFYKSAQEKDSLRFQSAVTSLENRIEALINTYIAVIKAGRSYVESTENLNRKKFSEFIKNLELNRNYSGIQAIGYIKRVSPEERVVFEQKMKAEGFPDFKIFPESPDPEKQPVVFIEPFDKVNRKLIGFDMASEMARSEALQRARDEGEAAATGKIELIREAGAEKPVGFLIFVPVYRSGPPDNVEKRRMLLEGYVYSPFPANNFLQDIQNSISISDIAVTIYETERRTENILAQTNEVVSPDDQGFKKSGEINVAGRKWIVEYNTLPSFDLQSSTGWTPLIFISGLIFSMLFFGITYLESYARAKAEKMSQELSDSEKEKGFLLEREQLERKRAEEASRAKDEFISIVSHELRTPLNSIAGWTKILYAENLSAATKKQALQKIDKSLRTQTKIVEELLDFSQLVSNKDDLSREKIDFSEIFEDVFRQASVWAQEKGVLISKENTLNGEKISGDGERLKRVIENLLSNAIKFTPKGGTVEAQVKEKKSNIELVVRDTGQGIRKDFLPHIFERFKQADSTTTRRYGGLGLGLAISSHIVKLHGGSIKAVSEGENQGATFIVRLPLEQQALPKENIINDDRIKK